MSGEKSASSRVVSGRTFKGMRAKDGRDELLYTPATVTVPPSIRRKLLDREALGKSEEAEILLSACQKHCRMGEK